MENKEKELYEFGLFRLDPDKLLLLHEDKPVQLHLKAFETLLVLIRHRDRVVLKEELMQEVWPDTFVEDANLAQNIFVLRKTLAASSGDQQTNRFIVTVPGRGYRFAENVRIVQEALIVQRHSRMRVVVEEKVAIQPAAESVAVTAQPRNQTKVPLNRALMAMAIGGTVVVVLGLAFLFRPIVRPPEVIAIRQITHMGNLVPNDRLISNGPRIYFRVWHEGARKLRSVSTEGGEVATLDMPFPSFDIDDISPSGSDFLVVILGDLSQASDSPYPTDSLWRVPVPYGSPRSVGVRSPEAMWSRDGQTVAYSNASSLFQANLDGTNPNKIADLPDTPFYLSWSPDGKYLRFSVHDPDGTGFDLWQADLPSHTAGKLLSNLPSSARPWAGGWSPDGKYFFYSAVNSGTRNIYAIRETKEFLRRTDPSPVQLTNGPFTFCLPMPSKDGKRLFVVGEQLRGELVRYDSAARQFLPYAHSISADHVAFSPDGQWMVYVEFPQGNLVRSRMDGSERRQLTYLPMRAFNPKFSPDGSQIAFQATDQPGGRDKIYLVSTNGGLPSLAALPSDDREIYPSWTSDGDSILFSSSDVSKSSFGLRLLDLKTRKASMLLGSDGLCYGQISPDRHSIVAIDNSSRSLVLYNMDSHSTRTLAHLADYPRWSPDGKFVYFNTVYFNPGGEKEGVHRWSASTNAVETVLKYPDFELTGTYGATFSLAPDGSVLLLKDVSNRDLYALDLDLP